MPKERECIPRIIVNVKNTPWVGVPKQLQGTLCADFGVPLWQFCTLGGGGDFVLKVGGKIDSWPFWTYIWEGGRLLTPFPPSIDASIHASTDVSTDVRVYPHLFDFFGNFKNSWKIYEPNKWKKCVSLLEFGAFLDFVAILAPQQQKKRKPKDSILPRWGEKNDRVCFPPKRIFWQEQISLCSK